MACPEVWPPATCSFPPFSSLLILPTRASEISFYDQEGQGYLREADLETYVYDLIGSLPALQVGKGGQRVRIEFFFVFFCLGCNGEMRERER
jgi:hypothetical protein